MSCRKLFSRIILKSSENNGIDGIHVSNESNEKHVSNARITSCPIDCILE